MKPLLITQKWHKKIPLISRSNISHLLFRGEKPRGAMVRSQSKCMMDSFTSPVTWIALPTACGGPNTWKLWCKPKFSRFMALDQAPCWTDTRMPPLAVLQKTGL